MIKRLQSLKKATSYSFNEKDFFSQEILLKHFYRDTREHVKALKKLSSEHFPDNGCRTKLLGFPPDFFKNAENNLIKPLFRQAFWRRLLLYFFLASLWAIEKYFNIVSEYMGYQFRTTPVRFSEVLVFLSGHGRVQARSDGDCNLISWTSSRTLRLTLKPASSFLTAFCSKVRRELAKHYLPRLSPPKQMFLSTQLTVVLSIAATRGRKCATYSRKPRRRLRQ